MPVTRLAIARKVADHLFAAERAIDLAFISIAELNAVLPAARLDAHLAAEIGQDALSCSAEAMILAVRMREQIVATHSNLKLASASIGLSEIGFGDGLKAPSSRAENPPVRSVA